MMLQIGASDSALQKELGAIQNPTLPAFNRAIEGHARRPLLRLTAMQHLAILHVVPPTKINSEIPVHLTIADEERRTVASHCAAAVSGAPKMITCSLIALTLVTLSAICAQLQVILHLHVVVDRMQDLRNRILLLLLPGRNNSSLLHLMAPSPQTVLRPGPDHHTLLPSRLPLLKLELSILRPICLLQRCRSD